MGLNMTPQRIYQELKELPNSSLEEVWQFIEFIQFKNSKETPPARIVKLGGLLADYDVDITEDDISQARQEMWGNLGEINE